MGIHPDDGVRVDIPGDPNPKFYHPESLTLLYKDRLRSFNNTPGHLTKTMQTLIKMDAIPIFAFTEINTPMTNRFRKTKDNRTRYKIYNSSMDDCMSSQPVRPDCLRQLTRRYADRRPMPVFTLSHGVRLKNKVSPAMTS